MPKKKPHNQDSFDKYYGYLSNSAQENQPQPNAASRPINISDELAREKKLKNDDVEQDIRLKKSTLNRLFFFLLGETIVTFSFAYLQATHLFGFALEEWSFKLLTSVTITQITVMLFVAVSYLFPKNKD